MAASNRLKTARGGLALGALLASGVVAAAGPVINVSEICTTCNDVIRCERAAGDQQPGDPAVVVYNLKPHTTWEQVVTIWDYLIRFGKAKQQDTRALTIYEFSAADTPPARVRTDEHAELDAASMTIALPGARIDRNAGDWYLGSPAGRLAGSCRLLPPAAGFAFLRTNSPDP